MTASSHAIDNGRSAASKLTAAMQAEADRAGSAQARAAAGAAADPLEGLDLAPLHRCLHLHAAMGRQPHFADYYRDNRRQQLASDLTPPANFIEAYQPFLAQVRTECPFIHDLSAKCGDFQRSDMSCLRLLAEPAHPNDTYSSHLVPAYH